MRILVCEFSKILRDKITGVLDLNHIEYKATSELTKANKLLFNEFFDLLICGASLKNYHDGADWAKKTLIDRGVKTILLTEENGHFLPAISRQNFCPTKLMQTVKNVLENHALDQTMEFKLLNSGSAFEWKGQKYFKRISPLKNKLGVVIENALDETGQPALIPETERVKFIGTLKNLPK